METVVPQVNYESKHLIILDYHLVMKSKTKIKWTESISAFPKTFKAVTKKLTTPTFVSSTELHLSILTTTPISFNSKLSTISFQTTSVKSFTTKRKFVFKIMKSQDEANVDHKASAIHPSINSTTPRELSLLETLTMEKFPLTEGL